MTDRSFPKLHFFTLKAQILLLVINSISWFPWNHKITSFKFKKTALADVAQSSITPCTKRPLDRFWSRHMQGFWDSYPIGVMQGWSWLMFLSLSFYLSLPVSESKYIYICPLGASTLKKKKTIWTYKENDKTKIVKINIWEARNCSPYMQKFYYSCNLF